MMRVSMFRPEVRDQSTSTIRLAWPLVPGTDVYKVLQVLPDSSKMITDTAAVDGTKRVYWGSATQCCITGLECNFCYAFRVQALVFGGADVGYTVVDVSEIVKANTLAPPPNALSLHRAIRNSHEYLLKRFLTARPDLLSVPCSNNGMLPLCAAVHAGNKDLVDIMLRFGADASAAMPLNGRAPLQLALFGGHVHIAKTLAERRASLRWLDCAGLSAAHYAVDGGDEAAVRFMLELYAEELRNDDAADDKAISINSLVQRAVQMHSTAVNVGILLAHAKSDALPVDIRRARKVAEATDQLEIVEMLDAFGPALTDAPDVCDRKV